MKTCYHYTYIYDLPLTGKPTKLAATANLKPAPITPLGLSRVFVNLQQVKVTHKISVANTYRRTKMSPMYYTVLTTRIGAQKS